MSLTETVNLTMPDGTVVSADLRFEAVHETNPCDKEPSQDRGDDDGWVLTDAEFVQ